MPIATEMRISEYMGAMLANPHNSYRQRGYRTFVIPCAPMSVDNNTHFRSTNVLKTTKFGAKQRTACLEQRGQRFVVVLCRLLTLSHKMEVSLPKTQMTFATCMMLQTYIHTYTTCTKNQCICTFCMHSSVGV